MVAGIDPDDPRLRADLDALAARTARTAQRTGMPTAMTSLVLGIAQQPLGSQGLTGILAAAHGTPVEWALCSRTVVTGQPYIVPDATIHPVEARNPLVTMGGLRAYAGYPVAIDGHVVGAACVLGDTPHHFTDNELAVVRQAADTMTTILEQHRRSTSSPANATLPPPNRRLNASCRHVTGLLRVRCSGCADHRG